MKCWLRAIWYALTNPPALAGPFAGAFISGHCYQDELPEGVRVLNKDRSEFYAIVVVGRCVDCGRYNVGWKPA
jgi:hypothetical protein